MAELVFQCLGMVWADVFLIWVCSSVAWLLCAIFLGVFLRTTQIGLARLGPRSPGRPRKGGEGRRVGDPTLRFFFFFFDLGGAKGGRPKMSGFFSPSPRPIFRFSFPLSGRSSRGLVTTSRPWTTKLCVWLLWGHFVRAPKAAGVSHHPREEREGPRGWGGYT